MDTRPGLAGSPAACVARPFANGPASPQLLSPGFQQELLRLQRLAMLPMPVAAAQGPQPVPDPS